MRHLLSGCEHVESGLHQLEICDSPIGRPASSRWRARRIA